MQRKRRLSLARQRTKGGDIKEARRRAIFEEGTTKILKMVEVNYPDLFQADDITKFKKAENVSMAIAEERKKISELQQAINDIHRKLDEEWIVWHGALYTFDFIATPRTWKQCIQLCNSMKYNTNLLCVESDEEEAFAVSRVKNKPTDYFIGVSMVGSEWHCYDRSFRIKKLVTAGPDPPVTHLPVSPEGLSFSQSSVSASRETLVGY
ncbi:uncharacterized protein LOC128420632 [Podarcis raffonei]|uniref:uncharacterized protein LOC128420632 n=1 Tax=Podarcis raffonei TaxID=65483 RepID=UPI0023297E95|nr:uncharacterized protein LOC128420632 [Podarcis raffonei]